MKARDEEAKRSEAAKAEALVHARACRRRAAIPLIEAENAALKKARDIHMVRPSLSRCSLTTIRA